MKEATCRQCGLTSSLGLDGLCADCVALRDKPDATATRTSLAGIPFQDMKQVDEQLRFKLIASHLRNGVGKRVGVMVETSGPNKGKGDRYIAGVLAVLPSAKVVSRRPGPVPDTETIVFKLEAGA